MVTHDADVACSAQRHIHLEAGRISESLTKAGQGRG
jgi:hypothetical protein